MPRWWNGSVGASVEVGSAAFNQVDISKVAMCWAQKSRTYWSTTHAEAVGSTSQASKLWAAALQAASMCRILAFAAYQGRPGRFGKIAWANKSLVGTLLVCTKRVCRLDLVTGTARTTCSGYCGRKASVLNGWKPLTVGLMTLPRALVALVAFVALVCHIVVHWQSMTWHATEAIEADVSTQYFDFEVFVVLF